MEDRTIRLGSVSFQLQRLALIYLDLLVFIDAVDRRMAGTVYKNELC
jgi:hypothetical protein